LRFGDFEHGALLNNDYEFIIGEPDQTRKAPVIEYEDFMNPIVKMLKKSTDAYVPPATPLWTGGKESRTGLIVPELIFKYGNLNSHVRKFPRIARWLIPAVIKRFDGYWSLKKNPARPKTGIDEQTLADLKDFAVSLGCHQIGFAEVPKKWVFKEKSVLYSHAIVLTMPMEKERMARAPQISAGKEVWRIYDRLGGASNRIAAFLRSRGFAAQAGAALGGDVNYPLLAQKAGLGCIGKNGLLISPGLGPSQRLAAVYVSIENLPEAQANSHLWIADFCESCNKCVRSCPAGAIYRDKPVAEDGGPRHIDYIKCVGPFTQSMGCSVCIRDCVFFSQDYEKIRRGFVKG
jgi:epoxyqueuosine reductase